MASVYQCHAGEHSKRKRKIAFDKFHIAQYLGKAVDKVRREEHKRLMNEGNEDLKSSQHDCLYNLENMTIEHKKHQGT